jgi:hypothetical protein
LGPAQRVDELHLPDGVAGNFQKTRAREDDGEATGAADGDVEPVAAIEEFDVPRHVVARGRGHGPHDFEGIQLRVIAKGVSADDLWNAPDDAIEAKLAERKASGAYKDLEARIGQCGVVSFAEASTSVPFVGAAAGALVLAQAIRLASMNSTARFLQMQMSAPDMVSVAEFTEQPMKNLGALEWTLR